MSFKLPKFGGSMVHSDPQLTGNIDLPIPTDNVKIAWVKNRLEGERTGTLGNGVAGNGKIVANTFNGVKDNCVIYDYNGNCMWKSGYMLNLVAGGQTPMVDINNQVIVNDNKKMLMVKVDVSTKKGRIVWITEFPSYEGPWMLVPLSPTIVKDRTVILPTNGPIYAFDVNNKGKFLVEKYLGKGEIDNKGYFSTMNSACVHDNRVYITTSYYHPNKKQRLFHRGRLYTLEVNPDAASDDEILTEAWHYDFFGLSQASPVFIKDTIYFDSYTPGLLGLIRRPRVHAITDKGTHYRKKWVVRYPKLLSFPKVLRGKTWFAFSKDPRGGVWFEDLGGKRLVRFCEKKGTIKDDIFIPDLIQEEDSKNYMPMSDMTICDMNHPIMIVSAINIKYKKYVLALDLENNNSVLWKVRIDSALNLNYAGGQFTILKKNNDPSKNRIVFGTYWDGVMAIESAE